MERPNDVVFSNDGKTMYIVDYGEVHTDFEMPSPFYTVPKSSVRCSARFVSTRDRVHY